MTNATIQSYNVKSGHDDRVWEIIVKQNNEDLVEFIVKYPNKDKSKLVQYTGSWTCNGTYFNYNPTCPHVEACKRVLELIETEIETHDDLTCSH